MAQDPAKAKSLADRLIAANRKFHAQKDPDCTTWERYSIPAHRGGRMEGVGCERHGVFLSGV